MSKEKLYEGKAKVIYTTDNPDELLVYYKDDATAGNGDKRIRCVIREKNKRVTSERIKEKNTVLPRMQKNSDETKVTRMK